MELKLPGNKSKKITLYGNPILATPAQRVTKFDKRLRSLVDQMFATMYDTGHGVGLAANQIGRTESIFVFDTAEDEIGCVVNPTIELIGDETQEGTEACLSLPGISSPTSRAMNCRVSGQDPFGKAITYEGSELAARCFQHECDHLNGLTYLHCQSEEDRNILIAKMEHMDWWGTPELDPRSQMYEAAGD